MHDEEEMPTPEDYQKLIDVLYSEVEERTIKLQEYKSVQNWRSLAEALVAMLVVFNCKRGSDVGLMTLTNFTKSMSVSSTMQNIIFNALSEDEKDVASFHHVIRVKGKRNRVNDVIITTSWKESIELLISSRKECDVLDSNIYVFAIPGLSSSLSSTTVLKKFIQAAGVQNMATRLIRRFMATTNRGLKGDKVTIDEMAGHMGHREVCRSGCILLHMIFTSWKNMNARVRK